MQKILGSISFIGAISLMFLGVLIVISPSEEGADVIIFMEQLMKFILVIAGLSVLVFTIKYGHGKEE